MRKTVFESRVSVSISNSTLGIISDEEFAKMLQENSFVNCWINLYLLQNGQVAAVNLSLTFPPRTQRAGLYMRKQQRKMIPREVQQQEKDQAVQRSFPPSGEGL
jgi:hypothetical protein